ncbi:FHA domain-containing protein [Vineibacter terrae]|uniref:FHA domain-containing protein n=1 Tax=Vineibacter terrae TaxID=2586908 RepID=UPI002E31E583|nr:FHA domain-containing protein [Vineibacter terrae]HEX2886374.1 FHA domain-containing protein [Vineibacter terrae]
MAASLRLRILSAPPTETPPPPLLLVDGPVSIGRRSDNGWVLPDVTASISRKHATVELEGGVWHLVDESANGTLHNGQVVGRGHSRLLAAGDVITIGAYEIIVEHAGDGLPAASQDSWVATDPPRWAHPHGAEEVWAGDDGAPQPSSGPSPFDPPRESPADWARSTDVFGDFGAHGRAPGGGAEAQDAPPSAAFGGTDTPAGPPLAEPKPSGNRDELPPPFGAPAADADRKAQLPQPASGAGATGSDPSANAGGETILGANDWVGGDGEDAPAWLELDAVAPPGVDAARGSNPLPPDRGAGGMLRQSDLDPIERSLAGRAPAATGAGDQPTPPAGSVERILDVFIASISKGASASPLVVGTRFVLTAVVRLPGSGTTGSASRPLALMAAAPAMFKVDARGCRLLSRGTVLVDIESDDDSAPASFIFEVESASECWVSLALYQSGNRVHQVSFSGYDLKGAQHSYRFAAGGDVELTLSVRAADNMVEGDSPYHLRNLSSFEFGPLKQPEPGLLSRLRDQLQSLQRTDALPDDAEQELRVIGLELADLLPASLRDLLSREPPKAIYLSHATEFDFPFELVCLEADDGTFFLGDRVSICRWYKNVRAAPRHDSRQVSSAAVLCGQTPYAARDCAMLSRKCRTVPFSASDDVYRAVFGKSDYDLLHFIGHCGGSDAYGAFLELERGKLDMMRIGRLPAEREFGKTGPVIVLNGCGTTNPYSALSGPRSFPRRFLEANASMVIGTLWPVHESVAHHFSSIFYEHLRWFPLAEALRRAKIEVASAESDVDGRTLTAQERVRHRVSARGYCAYGHPNMRIEFLSPAA